MFRIPRENASPALKSPLKPSTGRPPTPPDTPRQRDPVSSAQQRPPTMMIGSTTPLAAKSANGTTSTSRMTPSGTGKSKQKSNGSILSFFKKVDGAAAGPGGGYAGSSEELGNDPQSLFIGDDGFQVSSPALRSRSASPQKGNGLESGFNHGSMGINGSRYNEDGTSVKRRKLDDATTGSLNGADSTYAAYESPTTGLDAGTNGVDLADQIQVGNSEPGHESMHLDGACSPPPPEVSGQPSETKDGADLPEKVEFVKPSEPPRAGRRSGPFVEDSDSEDEPFTAIPEQTSCDSELASGGNPPPSSTKPTLLPTKDDGESFEKSHSVPAMKREPSSVGQSAEFDEFGDFEDEEYMEGEEYLERRYMEEQRRLEMAENGLDDEYAEDDLGPVSIKKGTERASSGFDTVEAGNEVAACPICSASLTGLQDNQAQLHVNNCLDGNPSPLPQPDVKPDTESKSTMSPGRFQRPARPAKPGQANPFEMGPSGKQSSAFSRLMASHAEDEAWATAAAAENAARGKAAYQRTCPFYKILPGFSICVDAFRYGAVEGCRAYFLSHFHSDHYVGLTASWQHGPIYCSRVTANLVRQQLRVDPKYVVDLEFEQKFEVPGTNGVEVTMIPANHCPGSSLYLFEKAVGKGKPPRLQRVLHCGDFRACPAHLQHPLLRPDQLDAVTGKSTGQQRIDVCYLDTTYLNPRYAFPSQENVIKACADMCVSLKKERADESDDWEKMKRERAGSGMTKFVRRESSSNDADAAEANDDEDVDAMKVAAKGAKSRGRLLVVVGTYSIGKERICVGIAKALGSKIFAPTGKQRICACLEDGELNGLLTSNAAEAQVHMTPLFEIRAETLQDYLNAYKPHFSRVVGFRPSGWTYRPPNSRFVESPAIATVLHSTNWRSSYSMAELVPQRGSTREASCFGVPYSEHSSFRELTMFCCALRIDKVIPTVNVGSAKGRERMKGWIERWAMERRKNGLFRLGEGGTTW